MKRETRAQWGARPPKARRFDVTPRGVAVHYPGVLGSMRGLSHDQHRALLREWQRQHMARGSNDVEYGSLICPCPEPVWMEGRTEFRDGLWLVRVGSNGTAAANTTHGSVQLMLGAADTPNDVELAALAEAIATLRAHGWGDDVTGHRDHYATACPGDRIYSQLGRVRRMADDWTGAEMPLNDADKDWIKRAIRQGVRDALAGKDLAGEDRSGQWLLQSAQRQSARAVDLLQGKAGDDQEGG